MWFRKKKPTDLDVKLTRSDFILSKIRELNGVESELYHKWHMGGAFNGSAFSRTHDYAGHFLDVYFYHEESKPATDNSVGLICQLTGMTVVIDCPSLHSGTEALVFESDRIVSSEIKNQQALLVSQVQRLQVSIGYECSENEHESIGENLIHYLLAPFKGKVSNTSSIHFPLPLLEMKDTWEMDGEIYFEGAQIETEVINSLKPLLPEVKPSIYGFGFVSNKCARPEMKWIHLTGRHF